MSTRGKKERRVFFNATVRLVLLTLGLFLQMALAAVLAYYLQRLSVVIMVLLYLISFAVFMYVSVHHDNPSTRPFWLLLIALFPGFGLIMYLMWGLPRHGMKRHTIQFASHEDAQAALISYSSELEDDAGRCDIELSFLFPTLWNVSRYLRSYGFPLCSNTKITYFPSGEAFFADCLAAMENAQKSIFLSFFILREGRLCQQFYEVLRAKAFLGVEIRLLIDDAGTMFNISTEYIKELQKNGIQVELFNPTHRYLNNLYLNYRNHQKMIIIDSDIGYTGGVNLADEYANYTSPFGYW